MPGAHPDEPSLYDLKRVALERRLPVEVVVGAAPGWADPWSRVQTAFVERVEDNGRTRLVDTEGFVIDEHEVQLARIASR